MGRNKTCILIWTNVTILGICIILGILDSNETFFKVSIAIWTCLSVADPGFSPGGAPTPKSAIIFQFFAENCMKMKEFGPPGGDARPWRPPLDPPMPFNIWFCHLILKNVRYSRDHASLATSLQFFKKEIRTVFG